MDSRIEQDMFGSSHARDVIRAGVTKTFSASRRFGKASTDWTLQGGGHLYRSGGFWFRWLGNAGLGRLAYARERTCAPFVSFHWTVLLSDVSGRRRRRLSRGRPQKGKLGVSMLAEVAGEIKPTEEEKKKKNIACNVRRRRLLRSSL